MKLPFIDTIKEEMIAGAMDYLQSEEGKNMMGKISNKMRARQDDDTKMRGIKDMTAAVKDQKKFFENLDKKLDVLVKDTKSMKASIAEQTGKFNDNMDVQKAILRELQFMNKGGGRGFFGFGSKGSNSGSDSDSGILGGVALGAGGFAGAKGLGSVLSGTYQAAGSTVAKGAMGSAAIAGLPGLGMTSAAALSTAAANRLILKEAAKSATSRFVNVLGATGKNLVPGIGGIMSTAFSLYAGENLGVAISKGVGSAIGGVLGGLLGTWAGPLGIFAGATSGSILGETIGSNIFNKITGKSTDVKKLEEDTKARFNQTDNENKPKVFKNSFDKWGNLTEKEKVERGITPSLNGGVQGSGSGPVTPMKPGEGYNKVAPRLMADLQKDLGISKEQAAGIVGSLAAETGGFSKMQEEHPIAGRGGYGYAQWTGPRRVAFENWAKQNNLDINSYEANYGFLKHELTTSQSGELNRLRSAKDATEASRLFTGSTREGFGFLRPGAEHYSQSARWAATAMGGESVHQNISSTTPSNSGGSTPQGGSITSSSAQSIVAKYAGRSHGESEQCVALVKKAANVGHTSTWRPGEPPNENTPVGTPIATFGADGQYKNIPGQSHAAIFLGMEKNGGIRVLDQWRGHAASERVIRPGRGAEAAQNFRVIVNSSGQPKGMATASGAVGGQAIESPDRTNQVVDRAMQTMMTPSVNSPSPDRTNQVVDRAMQTMMTPMTSSMSGMNLGGMMGGIGMGGGMGGIIGSVLPMVMGMLGGSAQAAPLNSSGVMPQQGCTCPNEGKTYADVPMPPTRPSNFGPTDVPMPPTRPSFDTKIKTPPPPPMSPTRPENLGERTWVNPVAAGYDKPSRSSQPQSDNSDIMPVRPYWQRFFHEQVMGEGRRVDLHDGQFSGF